MTVNFEIRNAIKKVGGDTVRVTLFLENQNDKVDNTDILECFRDAQVFNFFEKLDKNKQEKILSDINDVATDKQKTEKIVSFIEKLEKNTIL